MVSMSPFFVLTVQPSGTLTTSTCRPSFLSSAVAEPATMAITKQQAAKRRAIFFLIIYICAGQWSENRARRPTAENWLQLCASFVNIRALGEACAACARLFLASARRSPRETETESVLCVAFSARVFRRFGPIAGARIFERILKIYDERFIADAPLIFRMDSFRSSKAWQILIN